MGCGDIPKIRGSSILYGPAGKRKRGKVSGKEILQSHQLVPSKPRIAEKDVGGIHSSQVARESGALSNPLPFRWKKSIMYNGF
jgi:hypothetical protein